MKLYAHLKALLCDGTTPEQLEQAIVAAFKRLPPERQERCVVTLIVALTGRSPDDQVKEN